MRLVLKKVALIFIPEFEVYARIKRGHVLAQALFFVEVVTPQIALSTSFMAFSFQHAMQIESAPAGEPTEKTLSLEAKECIKKKIDVSS